MRFNELASPEDQLALWKLVSDKMWSAFGQTPPQYPTTNPGSQQNTLGPRMIKKPIPKSIPKPAKPVKPVKATPKPPRAAPKPKRAPMAPKPKPLPKPKPIAPTSQQIKNQNLKAQQDYAAQVRKELQKKPLEPHPGAPTPLPGNIISPVDVPRNAREKKDLASMARGETPWRPT